MHDCSPQYDNILLGKCVILPNILQFYLFLGHFLPVVYELGVTRSRASGNTSSTADIMITWNYDDCCIPVFIPKHYIADKQNQQFQYLGN